MQRCIPNTFKIPVSFPSKDKAISNIRNKVFFHSLMLTKFFPKKKTEVNTWALTKWIL